MTVHPIEPVFNENSELLILGSFPSVKSREHNFFYAHPRNRFWKVLAYIFNSPVPDNIEEEKLFLLDKHIALWDVIASCDIEGSSDSSIKNVTPNDLSYILEHTKVKQIYTNGKAADKLYKIFLEEKTGITSICLPSTSPANASWTFEKLCESWKQILM